MQYRCGVRRSRNDVPRWLACAAGWASLVASGCSPAADGKSSLIHPGSTPVPASDASSRPVTPGYQLSGDPALAGRRPLRAGETVGSAVRQALAPTGRQGPLTVLLVRRGPEGVTREMIDVNRSLDLKDGRQNYGLHDGDEIVLPAATMPAGLERPPIAHTPTPE